MILCVQETNPEKIEEKARMIYEDFVSILSPREVSICPAFPLFNYSNSSVISIYTVKKVSDFPVPSRNVTNQGLPGRENLIIPGQGEFG